MEIVDVRPDLTMIVEPPAQAYVLRLDGATLVVDTGRGPVLGPPILDLVGGRGPVHLLLTHWHDDHTGAAADVARATGATVYAGQADAPFVRDGRPGPWAEITAAERPIWDVVSPGITQPPPCRVDVELDDGDTIDGIGAVVVAVPGHTDGSVALHLPDAGVLFTGDVAAESDGQVVLGPFNTDRARARESFRRFAGLSADTVCFGHGRPLRDDGVRLLHDAASAGVVPDPLG